MHVIVYARHGRDCCGVQVPCTSLGTFRSSVYQMNAQRGEVRGEGNCVRVTGGGEEACDRVRKRRVCCSPPGRDHAKAARLRTETWYKAGEVRRVSPSSRSRPQTTAQVNRELVQRNITLLSGETCTGGTPVFDPHFSDSSHGFRPKRSAHGAAKQVRDTIRRGYRFVADIDLSKFFDRVQHDVLMARVARRVRDKLLLRLIARYLRAGVMVEGVLQPTDIGTPQGGPASPLLANILLDDLDKELERRGLPFVRYADDFAVFAKSRRAAERIMRSVGRYVAKQLRLVVNEEKSRVVASTEFEFLGFSFPKSRATINVAPKSVRRFKQRIREITGRSRGISMERRLSELRRYVRGWMGYFGIASQLKLFDKLDQWIRRRIRMCYWKQWRRPKRRRAMLIRLGVPRRQAIRHARSRKGYWRMAKTIASGVGMTNAWLAEQGLLSMKTLWAQLAPLRRTA